MTNCDGVRLLNSRRSSNIEGWDSGNASTAALMRKLEVSRYHGLEFLSDAKHDSSPMDCKIAGGVHITPTQLCGFALMLLSFGMDFSHEYGFIEVTKMHEYMPPIKLAKMRELSQLWFGSASESSKCICQSRMPLRVRCSTSISFGVCNTFFGLPCLVMVLGQFVA